MKSGSGTTGGASVLQTIVNVVCQTRREIEAAGLGQLEEDCAEARDNLGQASRGVETN